jgi:hypothetical protein
VDLIFKANTAIFSTTNDIMTGSLTIAIKNITTGTIVDSYSELFDAADTVDVELPNPLSGRVRNADLVLGHVYAFQVDVTNLSGPEDGLSYRAGNVAGNFPSTYFRSSQSPLSNANSIANFTSSFWGHSGSRLDVITSSNATLNENYGFLTQQPFTASNASKFISSSLVWTIEPGDEFRFKNDESKVYTVINVIPPYEEPEGKIKVFLNRNVKSSILPTTPSSANSFLIRRYVEDGSFIIFDENKPPGSSGAAFIKPEFTTEILNKDVDEFIQELKSKNLLD